jgi:ketosteroid isomerase-like protein
MSSIATVQRIYDALAAADLDALPELIAPGCVITQDPRLPWGGRFVGVEGLGEFALALVSTIDSSVTTESLFAADDRVIQAGRTKGTVRANGAAFDIPEVHNWRVVDGKVEEVHFAIDTDAMLAAIDQAATP